MADDDFYIDLDGNRRSDRRTGDPWRRHLHGRVDRIEDRLKKGDGVMETLETRTRLLAQNLQRNTDATERVEKATEQLVQIASKVVSTHDVLKWFGKTFVLWGTVGSMLITAGWIIVTGHPPWK